MKSEESKFEMKRHLSGQFDYNSPFYQYVSESDFIDSLKDDAFNILRENQKPSIERVEKTFLAARLLHAAAMIDAAYIQGNQSNCQSNDE